MTRQVIYVGDPMCSWCWGFSPVKRALEEQCEGRAETLLVVGGLHPGTTEIQDDERKKFLEQHWLDVGQRTEQPFDFAILERDDFVYDTEPACRAAVTMRELRDNPTALAFFSALQKAFYQDGLDITETEILTTLAVDFGLDGAAFRDRFLSTEMRQATAADFDIARSFGVSGFPTVLVRENDDYAYLTIGYQPLDRVGPLLEGWLDGTLDRQAGE
jgi:putative protein-disulfide isomerase